MHQLRQKKNVKMEFKELATCQLKQDAIHSFNVVSSEYHVGMLGSTSNVVALEMRHSALSTHTFPYSVETVKLPTSRPSPNILNEMDLSSIYSSTSVLKRHYIALDPVYVTELSEEPVKFQPVTMTWSPKKLFNVSTLAIVSNNGTCELRRKDSISREWSIEVCNLNKLYHEIFPIQETTGIDTFEKLKEAFENNCTTAFSWNMNSDALLHIFVTANATGWLLLFRVSKGGLVSFFGKYKTTLGRISCIYFVNNFIFVCAANGVMKMYTLVGTEVEEADTLWHKADRIPCRKVHMCFSEKLDKWIVITSKASHVMVFALSEDGVVQLKSTKYLGNMEITGFDMLSPCEYIFATITGAVKLISLEITDNQLQINAEEVKYEFDHANYQILGLVASPNKVAWTFVLFHNKPYTHPAQYSPKDAIISICNLSIKDAFTILKDDVVPRDNSLDCAEIVRLEILKNNISAKFEDVCIDEVKIDKQFFRKLQLKLLVANAGSVYQRLKYNHVKKTVTGEINSLIKIIECVFIYMRIQFLRGLKSLTPFQLLSGKCLKYKLISLQAELISMEDMFRNVQENLNTLSDCLIMDLGSLFDIAEERCSYCNLPIDFTVLMCPHLHSVPRCSISYIQAPMFTRAVCSSCNRLYLDDIDLLTSLFADANEMKCTFCGFMFDIDMKETYETIVI